MNRDELYTRKYRLVIVYFPSHLNDTDSGLMVLNMIGVVTEVWEARNGSIRLHVTYEDGDEEDLWTHDALPTVQDR